MTLGAAGERGNLADFVIGQRRSTRSGAPVDDGAAAIDEPGVGVRRARYERVAEAADGADTATRRPDTGSALNATPAARACTIRCTSTAGGRGAPGSPCSRRCATMRSVKPDCQTAITFSGDVGRSDARKLSSPRTNARRHPHRSPTTGRQPARRSDSVARPRMTDARGLQASACVHARPTRARTMRGLAVRRAQRPPGRAPSRRPPARRAPRAGSGCSATGGDRPPHGHGQRDGAQTQVEGSRRRTSARSSFRHRRRAASRSGRQWRRRQPRAPRKTAVGAAVEALRRLPGGEAGHGDRSEPRPHGAGHSPQTAVGFHAFLFIFTRPDLAADFHDHTVEETDDEEPEQAGEAAGIRHPPVARRRVCR